MPSRSTISAHIITSKDASRIFIKSPSFAYSGHRQSKNCTFMSSSRPDLLKPYTLQILNSWPVAATNILPHFQCSLMYTRFRWRIFQCESLLWEWSMLSALIFLCCWGIQCGRGERVSPLRMKFWGRLSLVVKWGDLQVSHKWRWKRKYLMLMNRAHAFQVETTSSDKTSGCLIWLKFWGLNRSWSPSKWI